MDMAINQNDFEMFSFFTKFKVKKLEALIKKILDTTPESSLLLEQQGDLLLM